jgi:phage-related tail fiber protein
MALTKPPVLPAWAEAGDKVQPSNAEIQAGWPLSNVPPARQRWNWLLNFLANGIRYLTRRGLPDWGADETYEIGDRVQGPDGLTYKALTQNTNKTPAVNPTDWARWGFTAAELGTELNKLDAKASCRVATTANLAALSGLLTIDGVVLVAGDRVLVKDQTTSSQNGIYVVAAGAWTRATDADDGAKLTSGATVPVEAGTAQADTLWLLTADGAITVGVTALTFVVINGNVGTPGTYNQVTVDAKGRVIAGSSLANTKQIEGLTASVAGNALTVTYAGGTLDFRNTVLNNGTPIAGVAVPSNSITIPSGATLGTVSGQAARLVFLEAYNGGSPVLCVANLAGGLNLNENGLISPTTISAGANSASTIYSAAAVSANSPYRVVGFLVITAADAGTWSSAPTVVQGAGGQSLSALTSIGYGQTWQNFTVGTQRVVGTTYYNTTGKPIMVSANGQSTGGGWNFGWTVNGVVVGNGGMAQNNTAYTTQTTIIPPGASYVLTQSGTNITGWQELR